MLDITVSALPTFDWTALRIERLTKLWAEGSSASEIAADLGGLTRSAVLGKLHRLGKAKDRPITIAKPKREKSLTPRKKKLQAPAPTRAEKAERQVDARMARLFGPLWNNAPDATPDAIPGQPCSLMQLTATSCRWPIGDPGTADFHFCGSNKPRKLPYCMVHHRIAYYRPAPSANRAPWINWGGR